MVVKSKKAVTAPLAFTIVTTPTYISRPGSLHSSLHHANQVAGIQVCIQVCYNCTIDPQTAENNDEPTTTTTA